MHLCIFNGMLNGTRASSSHMTGGEGRPTVVSIVALDGCDNSALLALAASLARGLDTPVAVAILESASEHEIQVAPVDVDRLHHATAMGIAATVAGRAVVLGNSALFRDLGLSLDNLGYWPDRLRQRGEQVWFVAVDGRTAGFLGIVDAGV